MYGGDFALDFRGESPFLFGVSREGNRELSIEDKRFGVGFGIDFFVEKINFVGEWRDFEPRRGSCVLDLPFGVLLLLEFLGVESREFELIGVEDRELPLVSGTV